MALIKIRGKLATFYDDISGQTVKLQAWKPSPRLVASQARKARLAEIARSKARSAAARKGWRRRKRGGRRP